MAGSDSGRQAGEADLVGRDAALGGDRYGVGCGWALQSAEWLVDCTVEALVKNGDLYGRLDTELKT